MRPEASFRLVYRSLSYLLGEEEVRRRSIHSEAVGLCDDKILIHHDMYYTSLAFITLCFHVVMQ